MREPFRTEHAESISRGMERGKMPQTLDGLLHWFMLRVADETPERLHRAEVWHDEVSSHERSEGVQPVGSSASGAQAWAGEFKAIMQSSPSITDEDGFYRFPVRAALSRMSRRRPLMARFLFALGMAGGDWQRLADQRGWAYEEMQTYAEAALTALWDGWYDRDTRGLA